MACEQKTRSLHEAASRTVEDAQVVPMSGVCVPEAVTTSGDAPHFLYATEYLIPVDEAYCGAKTYAIAGLLTVLCLWPCAACLPFCPCDTREAHKRRYLVR